MYRKLNGGKFEFLSFCDKKSNEFLSMHKDDFERLMNEATGSQKEQ